MRFPGKIKQNICGILGVEDIILVSCNIVVLFVSLVVDREEAIVGEGQLGVATVLSRVPRNISNMWVKVARFLKQLR